METGKNVSQTYDVSASKELPCTYRPSTQMVAVINAASSLAGNDNVPIRSTVVGVCWQAMITEDAADRILRGLLESVESLTSSCLDGVSSRLRCGIARSWAQRSNTCHAD